MPVVTNGHFAGATRVIVRDVEHFRTTEGRIYRDAHPMQRAAIIYQSKTPGLARVRMVLLNPVPEDVAAAFAKHDDALAAVNGKAKANDTPAPAPAAVHAVPKSKQVARRGAKVKKPVRGLTK